MCQGRAEQGILWGISAPNFRDSHKEIGIQEGIHRALMSISLQNTPDRVVRDVEQLINQRFPKQPQNAEFMAFPVKYPTCAVYNVGM